MSVAVMKKLTVLAHADDTETILRRLIRLKCVEVKSHPAEGAGQARLACEEALAEAEHRVEQTREALVPLHKYSTKKKQLFVPQRTVSTAAFREDGSLERARNTVRSTLATLEEITATRAAIDRLEAEKQSYIPWLDYDMPLSVAGTETTTLLLGSLPAAIATDGLTEALADAAAYMETVHTDTTGIYISVICYKEGEEEALRLLSEYGFVKATFRDARDDTASVALARTEQDIRREEEHAEALTERLGTLAVQVEDVETLFDVEMTTLTMLQNKERLTLFGSCTVLEGWIPETCEEKVTRALDNYDCAYETEAPAPGEEPPVLLCNNGFATNFEWVLGMYSYPAYGKFDPTFIMSIFYFIIFGLMFADVGYGLMLTVACFGAVALLHPREGMKRFLLMFGYCGISCMIMGAIFGGWFGDLPFAVMQNMFGIENAKEKYALFNGFWFNPLDNPIGFLAVSLAIGGVHLITGMAIQFWQLCRRGQVIDALCDIAAYWLMFAGIGLLVAVPAVGKWVCIVAAAIIVLTHGRSSKNIFGKLVKGVLGLYDLISYASDLLSYSRILALGLAAAVIGQVVNILGTMAGGGVVGFIALIVAFLLGHTLNLALNVLGTFVHTSRLQYIEFFGKFFEDGGVPFAPAKPSDTYTTE